MLNLIVPGAALVPVRREWLGLLLAILFAVCVNIWIAGRWIAPLAVPQWLSWLALGLAIVGWLAAQALFAHHARRFDAVQSEINTLLAQAACDRSQSDLRGARAALEAAAALDSDRPDVLAAEAALCEIEGDIATASRLRRRILKVAPGSEWAAAAQKSLFDSEKHASESDRT